MSFEKDTTFARVIEEHLDLKRRNTELEPAMPIDRYRGDDPFENHPLFKTEEQARLEETMDGIQSPVEEAAVLAWPITPETSESEAEDVDPEESLWGRSRDFDWGD